jgi:hypothetical protein
MEIWSKLQVKPGQNGEGIEQLFCRKGTVIKSFKKCDISNAMDGTEDNLLWDTDDEAETDLLDSEWDP